MRTEQLRVQRHSWREAATGKDLRQIEELVANHRPGDQPEDPPDPEARVRVVRFELSAETFDGSRSRMVSRWCVRPAPCSMTEHGSHLPDDQFVATGRVQEGDEDLLAGVAHRSMKFAHKELGRQAVDLRSAKILKTAFDVTGDKVTATVNGKAYSFPVPKDHEGFYGVAFAGNGFAEVSALEVSAK